MTIDGQASDLDVNIPFLDRLDAGGFDHFWTFADWTE